MKYQPSKKELLEKLIGDQEEKLSEIPDEIGKFENELFLYVINEGFYTRKSVSGKSFWENALADAQRRIRDTKRKLEIIKSKEYSRDIETYINFVKEKLTELKE